MSEVTVKELSLVKFDTLTVDNVCRTCGWYDWFCSDKSLVNRSKKMISLAKRIADVWGNSNIFLKNNCPVSSSTYDSFVILDHNGDNKYWIENVDGWSVIDVPNNQKVLVNGNMKQIAEVLNDLK